MQRIILILCRAAWAWAAAGIKLMKEILVYHWHCILPVAGILIAVIYLNCRDVMKKGGKGNGSKKADKEKTDR